MTFVRSKNGVHIFLHINKSPSVSYLQKDNTEKVYKEKEKERENGKGQGRGKRESEKGKGKVERGKRK